MPDRLHLALRLFAEGYVDADPVTRADARTTYADARIALNVARGIDVDDIHPTTGHDLSRRAYDGIRGSWQVHILTHGATADRMAEAARARAYWAVQRPEFTAGDDWFTGLLDQAVMDGE